MNEMDQNHLSFYSWTGKGSNLHQCSSLSTAPLMASVSPGWTLPVINVGRTKWGRRIPGYCGKCIMKTTNLPGCFYIINVYKYLLSFAIFYIKVALLLHSAGSTRIDGSTVCKRRAGHECGIFILSVAFLPICIIFWKISWFQRSVGVFDNPITAGFHGVQ